MSEIEITEHAYNRLQERFPTLRFCDRLTLRTAIVQAFPQAVMIVPTTRCRHVVLLRTPYDKLWAVVDYEFEERNLLTIVTFLTERMANEAVVRFRRQKIVHSPGPKKRWGRRIDRGAAQRERKRREWLRENDP